MSVIFLLLQLNCLFGFGASAIYSSMINEGSSQWFVSIYPSFPLSGYFICGYLLIGLLWYDFGAKLF